MTWKTRKYREISEIFARFAILTKFLSIEFLQTWQLSKTSEVTTFGWVLWNFYVPIWRSAVIRQKGLSNNFEIFDFFTELVLLGLELPPGTVGIRLGPPKGLICNTHFHEKRSKIWKKCLSALRVLYSLNRFSEENESDCIVFYAKNYLRDRILVKICRQELPIFNYAT